MQAALPGLLPPLTPHTCTHPNPVGPRENSGIRPGKTIVVGTEQGLYARARLLPDPVLVVRTSTESGESFGPETFDLTDPEGLVEAAQRGGFWSYVAGVAYKVATEFCVGGLEVNNYCTTLPLKKGLSSSAAVCVLVRLLGGDPGW